MSRIAIPARIEDAPAPAHAQIVEIVRQVALNTWTHCIDEVAQIAIDFPLAQALAA